jgi:competence protein ComEA
MTCFLAAGLLARSLTIREEKIENAVPQTPRTERVTAVSETRQRSRDTKTTTGVNVLAIQETSDSASTPDSTPVSEWVVYITGKVRKPGVYRLSAGARLFQLVEAAGGLDSLADPVVVNMASSLEDGLHVHIPARETPTTGANATQVPSMPNPPKTPQTQARQTYSASRHERNKPKTSSLVNVNRASEEELTSLKGIGPTLAKNIIKHRQENGLFRAVDDLLQVKGIGAKKLEGLRGNVTVGP